MKCDFCDNEANIEIVTFVNGEAKTIRMCSSCYKEKIGEMVDALPEGFGGTFLSQQLQALLEKTEKEGLPFNHMQIQLNMPFDGKLPHVQVDGRDMDWFGENKDANADSAEEEGISLQDAIKRWLSMGAEQSSSFANSSQPDEEQNHTGGKAMTGREAALDAQLNSLLAQRNNLLNQMNQALEMEKYEECARLRDQIDQIGDALIELNEERKKPNGV